MRNLFILFIAIFAVKYCFAENFQLKVVLNNIDVKKGGKVRVGLYKKEGFPKAGKQLTGTIVTVEKATANVVFSNLKPGKYAVAYFHDVDGDTKLNKNLIGYPTEPFGFSKNFKVTLRAPYFEEVCIDVKGNTTTVIDFWN